MELKDFDLEELNRLDFIQDDAIVHLRDISKHKKAIERYSTGFTVFNDAMEGGFKNGDLVIVSGISGHGKTSFAENLTYHLCKNAIPCLWFSYEVSIELLDKKFTEMGIEDFYSVYAPKKNTSGSLDWIEHKIKEGWLKQATKAVFIDDIDCLSPLNIRQGDNETIMLRKIAIQLKELAIKLDIIIFCMAQPKKLPEGKEPDMQDIANSAGIFQKADYVFMVYREKEKQKSWEKRDSSGDVFTNNSIIKIVKNRETGQNKFIKCQYVNRKFLPIENTQSEPRGNMGYWGERE